MEVDTVKEEVNDDATTAEMSAEATPEVTEKAEGQEKVEDKTAVKKSLGYMFKDAIHDKELKNLAYIRIVTRIQNKNS